MTRVRGMLMVGAGGRNSGKTEFACSVMRTFGREFRIVGVSEKAKGERDSCQAQDKLHQPG